MFHSNGPLDKTSLILIVTKIKNRKWVARCNNLRKSPQTSKVLDYNSNGKTKRWEDKYRSTIREYKRRGQGSPNDNGIIDTDLPQLNALLNVAAAQKKMET